MTLHATLTGADLHESKGVDVASMNTVAVANGSGSANWQLVNTNMLDTSFKNTNQILLSGALPDLSTPGSCYFIPIPINITVSSIQLVLNNAITVANGLAIVANTNVGTVARVIIPYSSSAAGTTITSALIANTAISAGGFISVTAGLGSTTTCITYFTITATMN